MASILIQRLSHKVMASLARLTTLGLMGVQLRTLLKLLYIIVLWYSRSFRGASNWTPIMPRDSSPSDTCASDRRSFPVRSKDQLKHCDGLDKSDSGQNRNLRDIIYWAETYGISFIQQYIHLVQWQPILMAGMITGYISDLQGMYINGM